MSRLRPRPQCLFTSQPTGQQSPDWWGRVTFFVNGLDEFYQEVTRKGVRPESEPQDSQYGERFFIVVDPDGHEIWYGRYGSGVAGEPMTDCFRRG
jgi:uncharacterized glyoxalase superfamily protein PhnB